MDSLVNRAGKLSDSLGVRIEEAAVCAAVGRGRHFSFSVIYGTRHYSICLIFDPHAAKYPGIAQIDKQSLLHVAITF